MGSKIVKKYGYKFVVDGQEKEVDESRFNDYGGIESYKEDFPDASVRMTSASGKQANIPLSKYDDAVKAGFALSKWEKNDTINEPSENDFAEYFIDGTLTEEQKNINNADTTVAPAMTMEQIEQAVGEADGGADTTATAESYPNIPVHAPNREAYKRNLEAWKAKNSMSADDMWASAEDEELKERLNRFDSGAVATHTPLRVEDKDANLQSIRDIVDRNKAVNDIYSDVNKKMLEYGQRDMLGKDRAVQSSVEFNPETKQFQPKYVDSTGGETFNKEEAKATSRAAEEIVRTQNVNDAMAYHFENDDELMSEIDKRIADIEAQGKEYTERRKAAKGQENSSLFERFISSAKDVDNRNKGTHVSPEVALSEDLNDPEFRNLITQKILLQQAKKRMEASKRKDKGFWGEFTEGGADALVNPETLGGSTFTPIIGSELAKVSKKWERGEKLTEDEQNLVIVAGLLNEAQSKDTALGYDIGDMLGQVLPFIAEVAMNPAQGSSKAITKGVFKGLMRRYGATAIGNKLATNIGKRLTTGALRAAGDIGQASALAGTLQAPKVIGGAGKRMAGTAEYSMGADGELKAKGFTKKEGSLEALGKSFATMAIENYTELLGEQFGALAKGFKYLGGKVGKGANKVLPKALTNVAKQTAKKGGEFMRDAAHLLRLDYINAFIKSQGLNKWINANEAFEKQIAFNGLAGEILEEEIAIPLNALLVGDEKIENLADYEHQMQILLGTALMTGGMAALRTPSFVNGKRKASKDYNKATLAAERAIGKEEWEALRDRIDLADNDVLGDEVATIANNSAYNKEQKAAIVNYAQALQKQRGYNLFGDVKQKRGQWDSLYDEGYEAEGDNMGVVVSQLAEARAKVGEVFAIAEDGKLNDPIAYMAKYGGKQGRKLADAIEHDEDLSNEEKAMLLDYAKAEYRYNAMMEGIEDRVDSQLEEDAKAFDDITNKDTGTVMKVLVKGKDDVQFYAKSGKIIYDNTTRAIDGAKTQMANGSPMVVLYDPQARKSIAVSVYDLELVVENVNADRLKVSMFESRRDALMAAEMQLVDGYATEARASILDRRTQEQKADEANSGYGDNSGNSEVISDTRTEEQKVVEAEGQDPNSLTEEQKNIIAPGGQKAVEATGVAERGGKAVDVEDVIAVYNFSKSDAVAARKQPEAYADIITDLEVDRQNAIAWSEGRQGAEQPDNWEYWKEREGLNEPTTSLDKRTEEQIAPETKEQKAVEAEGAVDVQGIVAEWNAKTGEKVQVANSVEEVANAEARAAIEQGVKVKGWYDTRTGEVVVYAPNVKSAEDLVLTVVHENVSHKGLRDTLGEDIYNKMCDKTWEMMDEATRAKYESYAGVNSIKDETKRHRAAADEYIASIAEKLEKEQKLTESERSIWSEVLKAIKEFIVKLYGDVKLTEQDIASIIRVSYDRMRARGDIEANSVNSGAEVKAIETAPVVEAPKAEKKVVKPRAKKTEVKAEEQKVLEEQNAPEVAKASKAKTAKKKAGEDIAKVEEAMRESEVKRVAAKLEGLDRRLAEIHRELSEDREGERIQAQADAMVELFGGYANAPADVRARIDSQVARLTERRRELIEEEKRIEAEIKKTINDLATGNKRFSVREGDKKTSISERSDAVSDNSSSNGLLRGGKEHLSRVALTAPEDVAKLQQNSQNTISSARKYLNAGGFNNLTTPENAVRSLGDKLKLKKAKSSLSYYGEFYEGDFLVGGRKLNLRVSTHPASGHRIGNSDADDKVSIVIYKNGEHYSKEEHAGYVEYIYDEKDVSLNDAANAVLKGVINLIENGEYIDETQKAKFQEYPYVDENGNTRFRVANESQEVFVSNAARAVEQIKQEKATPEQWLKMIEKQGGLKVGEDKWLGLSDWLRASDRKSLTKQEVLDFVNENKIKIEEVKYSQYGAGLIDEATKKLEKEYKEIGWTALQEKYPEIDEYFGLYNGEILWSENRASIGEYEDYIFDTGILNVPTTDEAINETREKYTTEGLERKREIALTVPTIEPWNIHDEVHFGDAGNGRAIAWVRFGETTDDDNNRVLVIDEIQSKRHQEGREKGYIGQARKLALAEVEEKLRTATKVFNEYRDQLKEKYDYENLGGSMLERIKLFKEAMTESERTRFNTLANERADAERLLQATRSGRITMEDVTFREYDGLIEGRYDDFVSRYVAGTPRGAILADLNNQIREHRINDARKLVPDAPFDKNWSELAMKRMLRLAADEGFDKVAWTTGEQQAARYDIGTKINHIHVIPSAEERYVSISPVGGRIIETSTEPDSDIIVSGEYKGKSLTEVYGKALADKIMSVAVGSDERISGDGLRIGAEGMKGFYDKMLPSFVNKYVKKWGAKVSEVELPNVEESGRKMWSIDVTPDMKRDVKEGQVMFRIIGEQGAKALDKADGADRANKVKGDLDRRIAWLERALKGGNPNNAAGKKMQAELAELRELKDLSEGEARFRFSESEEEFRATQKEAVEKKGIVMPNLATTEFEIVYIPRHDFTGTGNQAIEKAEKWAKENLDSQYTYRKGTKDEFVYSIDKDSIGKFLSESSTKKSANLGVHLAVLKKLPDVINASIEAEIHADYKKNDNSRLDENGINDEDLLIHRMYGAVEIDGVIYRAKTTIKERLNKSNNVYDYKVTDIDLVISGSASSDALTKPMSVDGAKLLQGVEKSYDKGKYLLGGSVKNVKSSEEEDDYSGEGGVRFRFIGEEGAKSMDKKEGTTARMDNLAVAKKMLDEYSYKEVKMATGWEKGMDGKWRYETPDFEQFDINGNLKFVQRHPDYARYRELVKKNHMAMLLNQDPLTEAEQAELDKLKAKWGGAFGKMDNVTTLDAYVQDDDLFKAYPELKSIRVKLTDELPKGTRGRFVRREADDILILDPEEIQGTIYLNSRYPLREVESTLIHEIQHVIQHIEGFAKGGNSEMINEEEQRKYEDAIEFTKERIESHRQLIHEYLEQQGEISDKINDWYNRHGDEAEFDAEMRALDEKWDAIDKKIDGIQKRIREDERWLEDHNKQDFRLGYEGYRALAGEVEARNVQKRRGMTAEERRNSLAEETEDVKRGQQIVVGAKDSGYSESLAEEQKGGVRFSVSEEDIAKANDDFYLTKDNADEFEYALMQSIAGAEYSSRGDYKRLGDMEVRVKTHTPNWDNFVDQDEDKPVANKILNVIVGDYDNTDYRRSKGSYDEFVKAYPEVKAVDVEIEDGTYLGDALKQIKDALKDKGIEIGFKPAYDWVEKYSEDKNTLEWGVRFNIDAEEDYTPVWNEGESFAEANDRIRRKKTVLDIQLKQMERKRALGKSYDADKLEQLRAELEEVKAQIRYLEVGAPKPELAEGESETDASYVAKMNAWHDAMAAWNSKKYGEDAMLDNLLREASGAKADEDVTDEQFKQGLKDEEEKANLSVKEMKGLIKEQIRERRRGIEVSNWQDEMTIYDIKTRTTEEQRKLIPHILEGTYNDPQHRKDKRYADYLAQTGKTDVSSAEWSERKELLNDPSNVENTAITKNQHGLKESDIVEYAVDSDAEILVTGDNLNALIRFPNGDIYTLRKYGVQYLLHIHPEAKQNTMTAEDAEMLGMFLRGEAEQYVPQGLREYVEKKEYDEGNTLEVVNEIREWYAEAWSQLEAEGMVYKKEAIEDYVTHIWDLKKSSPTAVTTMQKFLAATAPKALKDINNYVATNTPYVKERAIGSIRDGEAFGLVPKYEDITDIMRDYGHRMNEARENRRLVNFVKGLRVNGMEAIKEEGGRSGGLYIPIKNEALRGYEVHRDVKPVLDVIFGEYHTTDNLFLQKLGHVYDAWGGLLKKINLSLSFFHHGGLSETGVGMTGLPYAAKTIFKNILWDAAFKGDVIKWAKTMGDNSETPAYNDVELTKDAVSHFVQLGATSDYATKEVQAITAKLAEWAEGKVGAEELATVLDFWNKGMDKILWDYLHDGLKIYGYKKLSTEIRAKAEKEGWDEEVLNRALDEAGQLINDTYGGQHWDLLGVSPNALKWARRVFLSPDWTLSTLRQALAPFGFGQMYDDEKFWKKWFKNDPVASVRKRYGRAFWITAALYSVIITNVLNAYYRMKDEDEEKKKAEEIRKTRPEYKSPYELAYPEGMRWWDYTMLGNTQGHETHLFGGRYKDGKEQYVRWGKQFRELPELFFGRDGLGFPQPMIDKITGKLNPMINLMSNLMSGYSLNGFQNDFMRNTRGWDREWARLQVLIAAHLPYSIPTDGEKEFKMIDLVMPSTKGFSNWKGIDRFKTAILAGDMDFCDKVYDACVKNGLHADELLDVAIKQIEVDAKRAMVEGVEDLSDAVAQHDKETNPVRKQLLANYIKKQMSAQDYEEITKEEMREKAYLAINGGVSDKNIKLYDKLCNSNDVIEDWRITKGKAGLKKYVDDLKALKEETDDAELIAKYVADNAKYLNQYKQLDKVQGVITSLKKRLGEGKDAEVMARIREVRKKAFTAKGQEYGKKKKAKAKKEKPAKPIADYGKELSWSESEE